MQWFENPLKPSRVKVLLWNETLATFTVLSGSILFRLGQLSSCMRYEGMESINEA